MFAVPEVTRGIFPGIGGTQLLPRILGAPMAKEMIFTGRRVGAQEAKAIGLVNHLVPAGQARAKALEIAATIADNGPFAVRQAKKAIAWGSETDLETAHDRWPSRRTTIPSPPRTASRACAHSTRSASRGSPGKSAS